MFIIPSVVIIIPCLIILCLKDSQCHIITSWSPTSTTKQNSGVRRETSPATKAVFTVVAPSAAVSKYGVLAYAVAATLLFSRYFPNNSQLETAQTGILQNFGRFKKVIKPGFHVINPWTETVTKIDMKTAIMNLQPQQVMTKDNVTLRIETVVYYRTVNPVKLLYKLGNDFR